MEWFGVAVVIALATVGVCACVVSSRISRREEGER